MPTVRRIRNRKPAEEILRQDEHRLIRGGIGHNLPQEAPLDLPRLSLVSAALIGAWTSQDLYDFLLICSYAWCSIRQVPPDRGRSHETHANGEGCGACGFGLVSRAPGGLGSYCPAQLCGSVRQRAGGADERRGEKPCGIKTPRNGSFRFQKAVPRTEEKRRGEAPIGAPTRVMGRPFPSAEGTGFAVRRATGCGDPHQRLSALRPPRMGGHFPNGDRAPNTPNDAARLRDTQSNGQNTR